MKRTLFLFLGAMLAIGSLHAQTTVSGNVKATNKEPLQGCNVWFIQADTLAGGSVTDKKGNFTLKNLTPGEYVCRVSMIGYKKAEQTFKLEGNMRLPQFVLEEDATQLQEVTVTGDKRNIVKSGAGTTTFFLSEHAKKAGTAYEALTEIPKLLVNPLSRSISLLTGESPLVLIDGVSRPDYINVLNPELIESVEIIEVPSARYTGSEGVSSILNIHLKRVPTPTYVNGNISTQHAVTSGHGLSNFNMEVGNAQSSLYLIAQHFYFANDESNYYSETQSGNVLQKMHQKRLYTANSYYMGLGGDRIFSDKNYVAFNVKYIEAPSDMEVENRGSMEYLAEQRSSDAFSQQMNDNHYHQAIGYLYYKHTFNKRQALEATGNYNYGSSGSTGQQNDRNDFYIYNKLIDLDNRSHYGKLSLDYTNALGSKYNLVAGSNTSYSTLDIDDRTSGLPVYTYSRWQEYLYAGFDNSRSGSKFNYSLSLGMDLLFANADGTKNHYIDVLPSVALAYRFNQKHALRLSYNRNRFSPSASQLNPRNTSTDSLRVQQGNPYLTPQKQNHMRLSYSLNYKKLYLEPFINYYYTTDIVSGIGRMEGDIYISTYANTQRLQHLGIGAVVNYNLPFGNVNLFGTYRKRYQKGMAFSGDAWESNLNGNFYYKKISLRLAIGLTPITYSLNSKSEAYLWSQADLAYKLPKGWKVALMTQNFLRSKKNYRSWVVDTDYSSFSSGRMTDRYPMLMLHVSYSFKNKVENKWRQKKMFYGSDESEAAGIKVNN